MLNPRHEAFAVEYPHLASELFTEIDLFNPADTETYIKTFALWDTGKTLFSFAVPPLPMKINLVDQAEHINRNEGR